MKLLLSSNSTLPGEDYLAFPMPHIQKFLGEKSINALFIPYAAVTFSFDEYEAKVNDAFQRAGHSVVGIHRFDNPMKAIEEAEAIVVGGGNTWQLVRMLHDQKLMMSIRRNVQNGIPYIGWSAGSNVACPTLRTTNDMPIIDPTSFNTTGLVPFQINPHYTDANPEGHGGETREQRINEFIEVNPFTYVVGLREGTLLKLEKNHLELIGNRPARIFMQGMEPLELKPEDDFNFLLK